LDGLLIVDDMFYNIEGEYEIETLGLKGEIVREAAIHHRHTGLLGGESARFRIWFKADDRPKATQQR
jgi:hypothetical protein